MQNKGNRIVKNTLFLYMRMGVSIVFSFFTTRILLNALGHEDYGLYNVLAGVLSMLGFLSGSLSSSTQRFISYAEGAGDSDNINVVFCCSVVLHRYMAVAALVLFSFVGVILFNGILNFEEGRTSSALMVYVAMIISTVFSITIVPYDAVIIAHENMKFYSLVGIADVFLKLLIAITTSSTEIDKLLFYGLLITIESYAIRLIIQKYCKNKYKESRVSNLRALYCKKTAREMWRFAGWSGINIFSGIVCLYGISIIVNHYFGTILNASIGIASQLAGVLMGLTQNITKSISPVIIKSEGSGRRDIAVDFSLRGCLYSYMIFTTICTPIGFALNDILSIWLENVPVLTGSFCLIMLVSQALEQLYLTLTQLINASGDVRSYSIFRSISNLIALPIIIVLFEFGYTPEFAWWIRLIFFVVFGGIITIIHAKRKLDLPIFHYVKFVIFRAAYITTILFFLCCCVNAIFTSIGIKLLFMYVISGVFVVFIGLNKTERSYITGKLNYRV